MCMSDWRARWSPGENWVMLSWVGVSCTAATCWLQWADMRCSQRIRTVFELLAASRFRLEPHWNETRNAKLHVNNFPYVILHFLQMMVRVVPVTESHCPLFPWVSAVSIGHCYQLYCCLPVSFSTLQCDHGWYQLPRLLQWPQNYANWDFLRFKNEAARK